MGTYGTLVRALGMDENGTSTVEMVLMVRGANKQVIQTFLNQYARHYHFAQMVERLNEWPDGSLIIDLSKVDNLKVADFKKPADGEFDGSYS